MNESEKQFSSTRAASSTSGRAKNQIPISSALALDPTHELVNLKYVFRDPFTVAEKSLNAKPLERIEVVPCEYDSDRCHPQVMSVLRRFERHPNGKPRRL